MIKPMWDAKAVKAYETGQGVELVNEPNPHYEPAQEPKQMTGKQPLAPWNTTPPQPVIDESAAKRIATALGWEPKRKPLGRKEVLKIIDAQQAHYPDTLLPMFYRDQVSDICRAIEAAHGIKGEA